MSYTGPTDTPTQLTNNYVWASYHVLEAFVGRLGVSVNAPRFPHYRILKRGFTFLDTDTVVAICSYLPHVICRRKDNNINITASYVSLSPTEILMEK